MASKQTLQEAAQGYKKAWVAGKRERAKSIKRVSPYHSKDSWVDWWFYAGWDGKTLEATWAEFRAENERIADLMKVGNVAVIAGYKRLSAEESTD